MDLLLALVAGLVSGLAAVPADGPPNLVANGSFEAASTGDPAAPEAWAAAGNPAVKQRLTLDAGPEGKRCAKLECTGFSGDGPDFHVMVCQTGRVAVAHDERRLFAFAETCPGDGCALADGSFDDRSARLTCAACDSVFDLETREPLEGPARDPLSLCAAREVDGWLEISTQPAR